MHLVGEASRSILGHYRRCPKHVSVALTRRVAEAELALLDTAEKDHVAAARTGGHFYILRRQTLLPRHGFVSASQQVVAPGTTMITAFLLQMENLAAKSLKDGDTMKVAALLEMIASVFCTRMSPR
jgi:hypothetical protein